MNEPRYLPKLLVKQYLCGSTWMDLVSNNPQRLISHWHKEQSGPGGDGHEEVLPIPQKPNQTTF